MPERSTTEGEATLRASGLRVVRGDFVAVSDVAFTARSGRVLGILGPNGAGKSSLLKAVVGILPYEGAIAIGGVSAEGMDRAARARLMAYVPQQSELRAAMKVRDVVAQGRYPHSLGVLRPTHADREVTDGALAEVDATALAARRFTSLSQGERQRVLIARALATGARIVLLDEPTSSLDVGHALRLLTLLRRLAEQGFCVVIVLHALERALEWTDDALLLHQGRVVAQGGAREVICASSTERVYGVSFVPNGALGFRLDTDTRGARSP
jgi:iron complex transport system ATP-binding protein